MCSAKKSLLYVSLLVALTAAPGTAQVVAEHGVTFQFAYTVAGGLERGSVFLDNIDVVLTIDAAELLGWSGATLMISGLGNRGGSPTELVGDVQGVSNIDTAEMFFVQPDVQFVINPGTNPELENALVLGIRAGVAF